MTTAPSSGRVRARARQVADRLRAEGWDVLTEPTSDVFPEELRGFRPDLLAVRDDEHLIVEIRGLGGAPQRQGDELEVLAQRLAGMPGWNLELVWVGEDEPPAPRALLEQRAQRARALAASDPEAGLMLAWSAVEGSLVELAERAGLSVSRPGTGLITELYSRGLVTEAQFELLRTAQQRRNLVAHGRVAEGLDQGLVEKLADLLRTQELTPGTAWNSLHQDEEH